jgi:predicted DNA-binding transcriptional regulator AlpA
VAHAKLSDEILRSPDPEQQIGVSRTTLWRWERAGHFPKRIKLAGRASGYLRSEVEKWLQDRAAERETANHPESEGAMRAHGSTIE